MEDRPEDRIPAMIPGLAWTKVRPTQPGAYWYRINARIALGKVNEDGRFDPQIGAGVLLLGKDVWESMWYAGPIEPPAIEFYDERESNP